MGCFLHLPLLRATSGARNTNLNIGVSNACAAVIYPGRDSILLKSWSSTFSSPGTVRMIGMQRTRFNHVDLVVESRAAHALQQRRPIKIEVSSCDQVKFQGRTCQVVIFNLNSLDIKHLSRVTRTN